MPRYDQKKKSETDADSAVAGFKLASANLDCTKQSVADDAILYGSREHLQISVFNTEDVPYQLARQYAVLSAHVKANYPANVKDFRFEEILTEDNLLVFIIKNEALQAAAYASRFEDENGRGLSFRGFGANSTEKGLGKIMIAGLALAEKHWSGIAPNGVAVARVLPTGEINEASSSPFGDAGFHGARNYDERIDLRDIHLEIAAEHRLDGLYVGCHLMCGKASKIRTCARRILKDWNISYGKTRIGDLNSIAAKERDDG